MTYNGYVADLFFNACAIAMWAAFLWRVLDGPRFSWWGTALLTLVIDAAYLLPVLLLIAAVLKNLMKNAGVEAFLSGVRPCVVAMILATAVTMGLSTLGGYTAGPAGGFAPDGRAIAVFVLLGLVHCGDKKIRQKAPSPIGMILLSAVLGIVFWH